MTLSQFPGGPLSTGKGERWVRPRDFCHLTSLAGFAQGTEFSSVNSDLFGLIRALSSKSPSLSSNILIQYRPRR